ncbi:MAG: DinB family protein, partial [Candidatus Paceibacterota bacterium]
MKQKTTRAFKNLETQKKELISLYDSLSAEQRAFRPEPDSWNLLQVMRHIVTSERLSLAYIQRKVSSKANIPKAGIGSLARFLILQLAFYLPLKFKA